MIFVSFRCFIEVKQYSMKGIAPFRGVDASPSIAVKVHKMVKKSEGMN
jgi:hypothetical protein